MIDISRVNVKPGMSIFFGVGIPSDMKADDYGLQVAVGRRLASVGCAAELSGKVLAAHTLSASWIGG